MQKPKILVVEDDAGLQEALADTLMLAQYDVVLAANAEQALQQLKNHKIRLVVSDVQMGAISGLELLKSVKLNYPQLPVLMITANSQQQLAVELKQQGYQVLYKPVRPLQLKTLLRHLLERKVI